MSCMVATARGAVWAEHVAGIGVGPDGTLQLLTRQGHTHPLIARYEGERVAQVSAALLAAIDTAVRSAARDNRVATVITVDDQMVLHLHEYQAAPWLPTRQTKLFTVARVAAGEDRPIQDDEDTPPDPSEESE